jgi:branched-chain amino acid transport system substrate-binding protein
MGARMAIDDINNAGGIKSLGGAKLRLIEYDTGDSAEKAKDAAQRMIAQEPDLVGGFGCWLSTFTLAATEVTERAELPWLTLSYSDLITGRGYKYVFQSSPTNDTQAEDTVPMVMEMAQQATGKRPTKVAYVGDNSAAPVSFAKAMKDHVLKNANITLVADEVYTPPLTDATTIVQHIRSGRPDFVLMLSTNVPDDKLLCDKFAEMNLKSDKLPKIGNGGHWCVPELLKVAGAENLEGVLVGLANWPGKAVEDVSKRFIERTKEPWFGHDSVFAYVHTLILKEAVERAGVAERHKVMQAIRQLDMKNEGPALFFPDGTLKYDEKGRRVGAKLCIVQWQSGRPVPVHPESIAASKVSWPKVS